MSTRIGTVQPQVRFGHSAWLAGLLAVLVAVTIAVVTITVDRGEREAAEVAGAHGTAANTPTELSGGLIGAAAVSGTLANTPTELSGGVLGGFERGRFADGARLQAQAEAYADSLSGGSVRASWEAQADAYVDSLIGWSMKDSWEAQADAYVDSLIGSGRGRFADAARLQAQADAFLAASADAGPGTVPVGRRGVTPRMAPADEGGIVVNGEICHQCQ